MKLTTTETTPLSNALRALLLLAVVIIAQTAAAQSNEKPTLRYDPALKMALDSLDTDSLDIDVIGIEALMPGIKIAADSLPSAALADSVATLDPWTENFTARYFSPDPTRAVWMSALFPGLGQIYNRRFWKVPIVIGGFMGLGYATSWNSGMLNDYTKAYRDLTDSDPDTRSYMDFFPKGTDESSLDHTWLVNTFKSKKDYFRRNRDLCIISMVGVYLLAMVDAYVDASLTHFDISPDLSMQVVPALIPDARSVKPSVGMTWAINF